LSRHVSIAAAEGWSYFANLDNVHESSLGHVRLYANVYSFKETDISSLPGILLIGVIAKDTKPYKGG
jgi:hypothetical protein